MKKGRIVLVVILAAAVLVVLFLIAVFHDDHKEELVYSQSLDLVAATVEGEDLTLYDLAFYIAYEEGKVNEQAMIYDPDDPQAYWNIHTNGEFLRIAARDTAVDMMIHDYVYARDAVKSGISLSAEEEEACRNTAEDFWNDLTEEQRKALGIPEEQVYTVCRQIGLAEKQAIHLHETEGRDLASYGVGGKAWEEQRDSMDIRYNMEVLDRIEMGTITL